MGDAKRAEELASKAKRRHLAAEAIESMDAIQRLPGRTRLETLKVGLASRRQYLGILWAMASWAMGFSKTTSTGSSAMSIWQAVVFLQNALENEVMLDDILAEYLDAAHWEGVHSCVGGRLPSALAWLCPKCQKQGDGHLPRLAQATLAGMKRSPGGTKLPYPEEIVFGLAMTLAYVCLKNRMSMSVPISVMLARHC